MLWALPLGAGRKEKNYCAALWLNARKEGGGKKRHQPKIEKESIALFYR
jgi:hypothetical protein